MNESSDHPISVVIPARNATGTIGLQLRALDRQTVPPAEVIIVDNASTDGLGDFVRRFAEAHRGATAFRVVECKTLGVNWARNAGVQVASGQIVLLCDADDVVAPDWVEAMQKCLASHRLVGGVTVPFLSSNDDKHDKDDKDDALFARLSGTPRNIPRVRGDLWGLQTAIGANLGFHRSLWEQLGGFDVRINGSLDENEFVFRAALAGSALHLCPDALVAYRRNPSQRKRVRRAYQEGANRHHIRRTGRAAGLRRGDTLGSVSAHIVSRRATVRQLTVSGALGWLARTAGGASAATLGGLRRLRSR